MNYYDIHENAYKEIKEKGYESWDQYLGQSDNFDSFYLKDFIQEALAKSAFLSKNPKALEIGCGTGQVSCFLAENGFVVEGVDVSISAVEVAQEQAKKRNFDISYRQADVCNDSLGNLVYDLIVDAHCIHCIAMIEERKSVFSNIHKALKPEGYFWMETMFDTDERSYEDKPHFHWDKDGILWLKSTNASDFGISKVINGEDYIPHRRIYRDHKKIEKELIENGFEIVWSNSLEITENNDQDIYKSICKKIK
ncbi:MAG: hypothetical protein COB02_16780 [Candidatus Cloacimonadota bacterium]|nr:MAG: hypothetical protein COB02_16780 [Candidatus Cloacimonadota bacterium]